jgi:DNA processing protein
MPVGEKTRTINIGDADYPRILKKIGNPPKRLYCKGRVFPEERCFAVVGTRRCSAYGKQAALEVSGELAAAGLTIVSGLASGIDTCAHLAAVERNLRTIAVLGTGLDEKSLYPRSNLKLAERILKTGGCLLSEYPAGTGGTRFTFPRRNRIISGLASGVLVVEAKRKSGALITANWAKKQGKPVFALPGPIYSANSAGCHRLIKDGAVLTEKADDILSVLKIESGGKGKNKTAETGTPEEIRILEVLRAGPLYIDKIIETTRLPAQAVAGTISVLEIKNKIRNLGNNTFSLYS